MRVSNSQRKAADATCVLVKAQALKRSVDGKSYDLPGGNVMDSALDRGLCNPAQASALKRPEEPFFDEPNPGFCSGFLVGKNRVATAGHCIQTAQDCATTRFVFGFHKTAGRPSPEKGIPAANIYSCTKILGGVYTNAGSDWRIVQIDRDVPNAPLVTLRTKAMQPPLSAEDGVTVIGYPMGLPVKVADGATVRSVGQSFFVANLDTYGGNSGSAVFNTAELAKGNLLVEGILVRGETDFEITSPCYISKRCPTEKCRGEDVTLASEFVSTATAR